MLALAASLTDPIVDVTWVWYDHEEVASHLNGLGRIARNRPDLLAADFAILGRADRRRGRGRLQRHPPRRGDHPRASRAFGAVLAGRERDPCRGADPRGRSRRTSRARPRSTAWSTARGSTLSLISGGVAGNVIPDECRVTVNYRFAPDRSPALRPSPTCGEVFAGFEVEITDLAERRASRPRRPARPGVPGRRRRRRRKPKYGWTDVARFAALGIPAVNYGPGDPPSRTPTTSGWPRPDRSGANAVLRAWLTGRS